MFKMKTLRMSLLLTGAPMFLILALAQNPPAQNPPAQSRTAKTGPAPQNTSTYIPKNLEESMVTLRGLLKPDDIKQIQAAKEEEMARFHFGLGLTLRNRWGLWRGSRLAKYFNSLGIHHPDDMSGIILTSLWRQLHNQPIRLQEQVREYQGYWKAARSSAAQEERRVAQVKAKIKRQMLGLRLATRTVATRTVATLRLPQRADEGLSIRSLTRFRQGLILTAKEYRDSDHLAAGELDFFTPCYYLDLGRRVIHPIRVAEIERIEDGLVAGGILFLHGTKGGRSRILGIDAKKRFLLPVPPGRGWIRLGQNGNRLLAVRPHGIYSWTQKSWQKLCGTVAELPRTGAPPRQIGHKIYFRDEGADEEEKRLSWIDLTHPQTLTYFDEDIGLVGSEGPRWETVHSFAATSDNSLWIATGSFVTPPSLVLRRSDGTYRIGLFNGSPHSSGDLLEAGSPDTAPRKGGVYATGFLDAGNLQTVIVGAGGIYRIEGQSIQPLVRFNNTKQEIRDAGSTLHWGWIPTHGVALKGGSFVLGGHFGGTYLLDHKANGQFSLISLDEKLGKPLQF